MKTDKKRKSNHKPKRISNGHSNRRVTTDPKIERVRSMNVQFEKLANGFLQCCDCNRASERRFNMERHYARFHLRMDNVKYCCDKQFIYKYDFTLHNREFHLNRNKKRISSSKENGTGKKNNRIRKKIEEEEIVNNGRKKKNRVASNPKRPGLRSCKSIKKSDSSYTAETPLKGQASMTVQRNETYVPSTSSAREESSCANVNTFKNENYVPSGIMNKILPDTDQFRAHAEVSNATECQNVNGSPMEQQQIPIIKEKSARAFEVTQRESDIPDLELTYKLPLKKRHLLISENLLKNKYRETYFKIDILHRHESQENCRHAKRKPLTDIENTINNNNRSINKPARKKASRKRSTVLRKKKNAGRVSENVIETANPRITFSSPEGLQTMTRKNLDYISSINSIDELERLRQEVHS